MAAGSAPDAPATSWDERERDLESRGIRNRKDFRKWAMTNHPDRGGDLEAFQRVSESADVVFDAASGEKKRRPPPRWGGDGGRQGPDSRAARELGEQVGKVVAALRFAALGFGYRMWATDRTVRQKLRRRRRAPQDAPLARGVFGRGLVATFNDVGVAGMAWRPLKEVEVGYDPRESLAHVRSTFPAGGLRFGIGATFNPEMMVIPERGDPCTLMATMSKRVGPLQFDVVVSRMEKYFERSLRFDLSYGLRLDLIRADSETVSILPECLPRFRYRRKRREGSDQSPAAGDCANDQGADDCGTNPLPPQEQQEESSTGVTTVLASSTGASGSDK